LCDNVISRNIFGGATGVRHQPTEEEKKEKRVALSGKKGCFGVVFSVGKIRNKKSGNREKGRSFGLFVQAKQKVNFQRKI